MTHDARRMTNQDADGNIGTLKITFHIRSKVLLPCLGEVAEVRGRRGSSLRPLR